MILLLMALYISEGTLAFMLLFVIHNNPVGGLSPIIRCANWGSEMVHDCFNSTQGANSQGRIRTHVSWLPAQHSFLHDKMPPSETSAQRANAMFQASPPGLRVNALAFWWCPLPLIIPLLSPSAWVPRITWLFGTHADLGTNPRDSDSVGICIFDTLTKWYWCRLNFAIC